MASPTTAAAGTAQTSLRSMAAGAFCIVVRSTERSGFISVAIGFMKPVTRTSWPLVTPPSRPPALLVGRTGRSRRGRRRQDLVVHARAGTHRHFGADADADGLDRVDAHHRLAQPAIELAIPLHVGPETRGHAGGDDFERAAERVAGLFRRVDRRDHPGLQRRVHAAERGVVGQRVGLGERHHAAERQHDVADGRRHGSRRRMPNCASSWRASDAGGDARGRFAGAGAFQHVADVVVAVLEGAGQVGVARAGAA